MGNSQKKLLHTGIVLAAFASVTVLTQGAWAAAVTFDFNGITSYLDSNSSGGRNAIANYMNGVLTQGSVTVQSGVASQAYTGDGHAVGPTVSHFMYSGDLPSVSGGYPLQSNYVVPLTLGNTDGCAGANSSCSVNMSKDTFLMNPGSFDTNDTGYDDEIKLTFSNLKITNLAFDYEIFPDGSSQQPPDISLAINGMVVDLNTATSDTSLFGIAPGDAGTYTHSPTSGTGSAELSRQLLGTTGTINLSQNIVDSENCTSGDTGCTVAIEFIDWPQRIGIDNLVLNNGPPPPPHGPPSVPAPPALSLFLVGLSGLGFMRRRRRVA